MAETISEKEFEAILEKIQPNFQGFRDRAFLTLLYRCGLRCNEARMLDMRDLDRTRTPWTLRVSCPKGKARGAKPRVLGIDAKSAEIVTQYLKAREWLHPGETGPLFITTEKKRIDNSHFRRKLAMLRASAGIAKRVHPHALRHSFARGLNDEGVSMRLIQLALGHADLGTTAVYLRSLGDPEVIETTSKREW